MTQADAEYGRLPDQLLYIRYLRGKRFRIARPVGEKNTIGFAARAHLPRKYSAGTTVTLHPGMHQAPQYVVLDPEIVRDNMEPRAPHRARALPKASTAPRIPSIGKMRLRTVTRLARSSPVIDVEWNRALATNFSALDSTAESTPAHHSASCADAAPARAYPARKPPESDAARETASRPSSDRQLLVVLEKLAHHQAFDMRRVFASLS